MLLLLLCLAMCCDFGSNDTLTAIEKTAFFVFSENLCKTYPPCVDAFFINTGMVDSGSFRVILEDLMYRTNTDIQTACSSDALWLKFMSLARPCRVNEILDPETGCVCHPYKVCKEESTKEAEVGIFISVLGVVGIAGFLVYFGSSTLANQRKILKTA